MNVLPKQALGMTGMLRPKAWQGESVMQTSIVTRDCEAWLTMGFY